MAELVLLNVLLAAALLAMVVERRPAAEPLAPGSRPRSRAAAGSAAPGD